MFVPVRIDVLLSLRGVKRAMAVAGAAKPGLGSLKPALWMEVKICGEMSCLVCALLLCKFRFWWSQCLHGH